jgi:membrane-bound ClpP family serine protease
MCSIFLTNHWAGFSALIIFIVAYGFVMAEEFTHLRKSKPVVLAAGLIWGIVAFVYSSTPHYEIVEEEIRHSFLEYAELAFFLLVAMTLFTALKHKVVFEAVRSAQTSPPRPNRPDLTAQT